MKKFFFIMLAPCLLTYTSIQSSQEESKAPVNDSIATIAQIITSEISQKLDLMEASIITKFNSLDDRLSKLEVDHARTREATNVILSSVISIDYKQKSWNPEERSARSGLRSRLNGEWALYGEQDKKQSI